MPTSAPVSTSTSDNASATSASAVGSTGVSTSDRIPPAPFSKQGFLVIRGARQHNLKGLDLDLPRNKLIVITGPSGSGKSSLAFDTIYAEGQRRYVESLSSYARQFLERMDKPDVDFITGLAPAIAIEQRTTTRNPRSTVATQTELYDYLRLLYARIGITRSPVSGEVVTRFTPHTAAKDLGTRLTENTRFYVTFACPTFKGQAQADVIRLMIQRGFSRVIITPTENQAQKGAVPTFVDLSDDPEGAGRAAKERLYFVTDRLVARNIDEAWYHRLADSLEQTFVEGSGYAHMFTVEGEQFTYTEYFERDGIRFEEPTPNLFAFNSPLGACKRCEGFGRVPAIDPDLVIPNPQLSVRQGAVAPFRTQQWASYFRLLVQCCAEARIDIDLPFEELSKRDQDLIWNGKGDYPGVHGFFSYLQKKNYKMHYRIYYARFRGYGPCPDCDGYRLRAEARYVKVADLHLGQVVEMTAGAAYRWVQSLTLSETEKAVAGRVLEEIEKRLRFLVNVGLDYLTLDRLSQTLSGGENQRINLATALGSSLVGSLYVLDEPSIGLHPRDTDRLIKTLEHLRDIGNTVIVVEHDVDMMRRADIVLDLGPGAGYLGGQLQFMGTLQEMVISDVSLTGQYLSGKKEIPLPAERRKVRPSRVIRIENARSHNLKRISVDIPLHMIACVTGVSGSGKSTLVHHTLYQALRREKGDYEGGARVGLHEAIRGADLIEAVEMVDQSPIGRSPRSNPVTYLKAFDGIRELFATTPQGRLRGLTPGYFSFNVAGGRCEQCQGEGMVQVEMQFLADLYLECEACRGKRYKQDALEVTYRGKSIYDVLEMTVDEACSFFSDQGRVASKLDVLRDIGLGYLKLGQPSNTLSGGEAQRIKLAVHLSKPMTRSTLYIFDEPTTGLHLDDIRRLLKALNALVQKGHSVLLVEHNLDVIKCADWVIDMGPEGGMQGGKIVAEGTPEQLLEAGVGHTAAFLKQVMPGHA